VSITHNGMHGKSGRLVVRFEGPGCFLRFLDPGLVLPFEDAEVEPKLWSTG
jgi:hypothetical protein